MLKILYAFRSLLPSVLAVWATHRAALIKAQDYMIVTITGPQIISDITFSLCLWVVYCVIVEDLFQIVTCHLLISD